jgi:hypothetical protein
MAVFSILLTSPFLAISNWPNLFTAEDAKGAKEEEAFLHLPLRLLRRKKILPVANRNC